MKNIEGYLRKVSEENNISYEQVKRIYDTSNTIQEFKIRIFDYISLRSYEVK